MGSWQLILYGNESYPFPLSIRTADGMEWITRDGTVSSLERARLITAAPDLLQAVKAMMVGNTRHENGGVWGLTTPAPEACELAYAAIAKAEGRD